MKEYLRQLADQADNDILRACMVREYLQARILESLQDGGMFTRWAFVGGTSLRFLYSMPRFSEDLDFSLITPGDDSGMRTALADAKRALEIEGYPVEVKVKDHKTVSLAMVKFPGLPHELGLSPHASQTLSTRVEVDTNPPSGAAIETSMVRRHVALHLCHHDKASLLAGKLHAILSRPWAKGRDLYDLAWYLADRDWPPPNLELLNSALSQTGWGGSFITSENWRAELARRLEAVDWDRAQADVRPFLERPKDIALVSADTIAGLLK